MFQTLNEALDYVDHMVKNDPGILLDGIGDTLEYFLSSEKLWELYLGMESFQS